MLLPYKRGSRALHNSSLATKKVLSVVGRKILQLKGHQSAKLSLQINFVWLAVCPKNRANIFQPGDFLLKNLNFASSEKNLKPLGLTSQITTIWGAGWGEGWLGGACSLLSAGT